MQIVCPIKTAYLTKRYKRFLADVKLPNDEILTVHCPNSGSMKGCSTPGRQVIISQSSNPKRKYAWTLEMIRAENSWIGVNTFRTNQLVHEAFEQGIINDFGKIDSITREIKVSDKSRLDFLLLSDKKKIFIEVKNCSLAEKSTALFPDAVTQRGTKHLLELAELARQGFQTGVIFCIQREDVDCFTPAAEIDPVYTETIEKVHKEGVKVLAYKAGVRPESITIIQKIPVFLSGKPIM